MAHRRPHINRWRNVCGRPLAMGKGGMLEKRTTVIRGLPVAGTRGAGTAAKRPTIPRRSTASRPPGTKSPVARRGPFLARCRRSARHGTSASRSSVSGGGGRGVRGVRAGATSARAGAEGPCADPRGHERRRHQPSEDEDVTGREAPPGAERGFVPSARSAAVFAACGAGEGPVPARRLAPSSPACAAGTDSPRGGIFLRSPMAVMDSVRHPRARGPAAGGRAKRERGARETRSPGAGEPRPGRRRRVPPGNSRVGGASRARNHPRDTPWDGAPKGDCEWFAGANGACPRVRSVRRSGPGRINSGKPTACRAIQVPWGGSAWSGLARDNCCYREPNWQFCRFRRAAPRPPGRVAAILGSCEPRFNRLD